MINHNTITTTLPLSALVVGNHNNIGLYLAQALLDSQVSPFFASTTDILDQDLYHQLKDSGNFFHQPPDHLSPSTNLSYVFHIFSPDGQENILLKQSLELATHFNAKFCYIAPHPSDPPNLNLPTQNLQPAIIKSQQLIKEYKLTHPLNLRVVHLNHLFGPAVSFTDPSQLGFLFSTISTGKFLLSGDQSSVFPLFLTDAASGILRATFSAGGNDKIFELAGEQISLLNFSLKIRRICLALGIATDPNSPTISFATPPNLVDQFAATKKHLRWQPDSQLDSTIDNTINWFQQHLNLSQPSVSITNSNPQPQNQSPSPNTNTPQVSSNLTLISNLTPLVQPPKPTTHLKPKHHRPAMPPPPQTLPTPTPPPKPHQPATQPVRTFEPVGGGVRPKKFKLAFLVFLFFLITLVAPISTTIFALYQTAGYLNTTYTNLRQGNITAAHTGATKASKNLTFIYTQYRRVYPATKFILGESAATNINHLFTLAQTTTSAIIESTTALSASQQLVDIITGQSRGDLPQIITSLSTNTTAAYHQLSKLQAELNEAQNLFTLEPFSIGTNLKKISDYLPEYRSNLARGNQLLQVLPDLLGYHGKKTYLVLFQNNAELRPTGGFIGSYALVTFESGQLLDIKVEDVYAADGQLNGHVEPPEAIKKYLGEAGWFLRDSNWDPNFPTSANRAAWFLEKELGHQVDGVVAINLTTIQDLLAITGPITVPDYNEQITTDNLFERAEYQVEINQFPGSTQKRDFIGKLSNTLIDKIMSGSATTWYQVIYSLVKSADHGQLLVSVNHPQTEKLLSSFGWTGQLLTPSCSALQTSSCTPDYLSLVEANVGVNKANYFIDRSLELHTTITPTGSLNSSFTITLKNKSVGDTWPGGVYKDYIRLYLPPGSILQQLTIDQQTIEPAAIDVSSEHGKTVIGFLTSVAPGATSTITLDYQPSVTFNFPGPTTYALTFQKQSGTPADPIKVSISYPQNLSPVPQPEANISGSTITFTSALSSNKLFTVEFAP